MVVNIVNVIVREYTRTLNKTFLRFSSDIVRQKLIYSLKVLMNNFVSKNQVRKFKITCDETNNLIEDFEKGYINLCVFYKNSLRLRYKKIVLGSPRYCNKHL